MESDSMDLKVRELLKEVTLDYSPTLSKHVNDTVSAIKDAIDKIPDDLKVTADEAPGFVRDIGADKVEFKFKKPTSIEIGGSYAIQCIVKPDINVDLFIRLPKECFHEKDYLNYRYHAKRCLYLSIIKKYLKFSSVKVEWSTLQNEARKPVLLVYPAMELVGLPGFFVRIIPTTNSLFTIKKLNLKRSNIRALTHGGIPQATPKYNSSILEDMFLEDNSELIKKTFLGWKELGEASILLKVWARQRSSIYVHDCLNGFLIPVILSYLASQNKIANSMRAMQIFRVTLNFIATAKIWNNGLYFRREGQKGIPQEERVSYKEAFPIVICDPSAPFNMSFRMSRIGFVQLQDEAALTLKCKEKCRDGGFEEIFMTKVDSAAKYDYCIRLDLKGESKVHASGYCLDDECWRLYEQKVHSLLNQGLNNRAKLIRVTWRNALSECNIENGFSILDREPLLVGVSVSSMENAFRVVDIGPNAENKEEALKFRNFWGEKAELRRFKPINLQMEVTNLSGIAKRWVASHLFSSCLVEEAVELCVAHLFFKPIPFNAPCSRITGFLRFLRLLSEYDWTFSAFVVDINKDLSTKDEKEISNNFMLTRKGYEENKQNVSAAMFLARAYDKASEAWTRFSPNVSVHNA